MPQNLGTRDHRRYLHFRAFHHGLLWDYPFVTLGVESALVLGGLALYMGRTRALKSSARYSMPLFVCAALGLQTAMAFGPPPSSDGAMAVTALVAYAVLAGVIAWLEKGRTSEAGIHGGV